MKRAYRRGALRLHPDKALHALPAGGATAGLEAALVEDAARLFKLLGDAHGALADDAARAAYDDAEAARAARAARAAAGGAAFRGGFGYAPQQAYARRPPPPRHSAGAYYRPGYGWTHAAHESEEESEEEEEEEEPPVYSRYGGYYRRR